MPDYHATNERTFACPNTAALDCDTAPGLIQAHAKWFCEVLSQPCPSPVTFNPGLPRETDNALLDFICKRRMTDMSGEGLISGVFGSGQFLPFPADEGEMLRQQMWLRLRMRVEDCLGDMMGEPE